MRNLFIIIGLMVGTIQIQAQSKNVQFTSSKKIPIQLEHIESWFSYIPTSSYRTQDNKIVSTESFYMMKFEVPNMLYRLFTDDLKVKGKTNDLSVSIPDTSAWGANNQPYIHYYFQHPAYNQYPVVQVSKAGIKIFCDWLNEQVKNIKLKNWKDKKIKFRLPTEVEWMVAASGGDTNAVYAWKGPYMRTVKKGFEGDFMANFSRVGDGDIFREENGKLTIKKNPNTKYQNYFVPDGVADITAPVLNYWPNAYGIFCMTGNVREMVQEEGFTKGGGWMDPGGECSIDFRNTYHKLGFPCEGFRLVVEVE